MDFQVRAAAGRLSEVLGKPTLERDRMNRRIGLNAAAAQLMRNNQKNILMREAAGANCAGVNTCSPAFSLTK